MIGGDKFDDAILISHRVGLDETVLVHHLRAHGNRSAVGDEFAFIVHRTAGQGDCHAHAAAVGTFAQQHRLSRRKADAAAGRFDIAVVFNLIGDEKCRAAVADFDLAIIDDALQGRRTVKFPTAAGILRRQAIRRGDDQPGGAHERVRSEIKTGGIDQHHDAVGLETAVNLRWVRVVDLVPHDGGGGRFLKNRGIAGGNVEALPVEDGVLRSGGDGELRAAAGGGGGTGLHGHARWIGRRVQRDTKH